MNHHCEASCEVRGQHVVTTTSDVVDGFERKSFELLEYINSLESKLERQRCEFNQRERQLEGEKTCVERKLEIAQLENVQLKHDHRNFVNGTERTIQSLTKDLDAADLSLRKERRRVQDLDNIVTDLKHQLLQKQQFYDSRKVADEEEMNRLEEQVNMLTKKVSLGWILGRLSEVYLRLEPHQQQGGGGSGGTDGSAGIQCNIDMDRIEKEVRGLIESSCAALGSPKAKDAATAQQGVISSSDDEESESENDEEIQRKLRNLRSTRRGESASPPSRTVRKRWSNIADVELAPSKAGQSCDEAHNYVQTDIEIVRESETRTRRSGPNNSSQPVPNDNATMQKSHISSHPASYKSSRASSCSPPRSPCKKDVTCNINTESSSPSCAIAAALSSPRSPADKDISHRQRDLYKFISDIKSKTKITSSSSNF